MFTRTVRARGGALVAVASLVILALSRGAAAATPSELLQKAIYTEETVGNLDEAIKLYEQVIAEGRAAKNAAAQAQYRLGLAYLKKDKRAEATAAFQALIKDFPGEKDLIAKAQKHLPSKLELLPAPWTDGESAAARHEVGDRPRHRHDDLHGQRRQARGEGRLALLGARRRDGQRINGLQ
jgi:tetratricopeptide (TPR) repeat protein